jgi:hypothetical protein
VVRVDRARQRRAALLHASQLTWALLWRRLQLQGDCEHLRWIGSRQSQGVGAAAHGLMPVALNGMHPGGLLLYPPGY